MERCRVEAATKDHTLVRKPTVSKGTDNWTVSAGTNENDSEWFVLDLHDWSNLGTHESYSGCGSFSLIVNMRMIATAMVGMALAMKLVVLMESSLLQEDLMMDFFILIHYVYLKVMILQSVSGEEVTMKKFHSSLSMLLEM